MPQTSDFDEGVDYVLTATSRLLRDPIADPVPDPFDDLFSTHLDEFGMGQVEPWWWDEDPVPMSGLQRQGSEQDFSRWMSQYENGRIQSDAMAQIGSGHFLRPDAATAYMAMVRAAKRAGVEWSVISSYRTYAQQVYLAQTKGLYSQGGLAASPGTSDHGWGLATDLNLSDAAQAWMSKHAGEYGFRTIPREPWHWEYEGGYEGAAPRRPKGKPAFRYVRPPSPEPTVLGINIGETPYSAASALPAAVASVLLPDAPAMRVPVGTGPKGGTPRSVKGVKGQLYQGFMDAGRPDLAKMVFTDDFDTWIKAESGWDTHNVSRLYTTSGGTFVNGGLFQIRYVHEWARPFFSQGNSPNGQFRPSAYDQARLIARYFSHLSPTDIRRYADQIRSNSYGGWG